MYRLSQALAALCLVAALWHPAVTQAHGVGSRELDPGAARAMVFLYADGEAMAFAQVQVTAPDGTVHQSARTDGRGGFAFLPSGSGVWRVAASDGQGHRAEREVSVAAPSPAAPADGTTAATVGPGGNASGQPGQVAQAGQLGPLGRSGQPESVRQSGTAAAAPVAMPASSAGIGPSWRDVALGLSLLANLALGAACLRRPGR